MKLRLSFVIACMVVEVVSAVTIVNHTPAEIHARVTTTSDGMVSEDFYDISPGNSESWLRSAWQVAFILRDDTGNTETLVVKPGITYTIT
ncbi:hypothetical protein DFQ27_005797 [Actinomortierella ambigua]|uniref:Uncharacterized protein n=1 Tax=Actinomortierella ambigua TaxID=1343610 RepID=A0A9P6PZY4_9FUNG|nr:hypothetical protein DFQ27_005797 [Actinomortierella ambigua]